jgi:uncharacterized LabA/DUF88 family protein
MNNQVLERPKYFNQVALFVDASNLFYAAQTINLTIDYLKLKNYLTRNYRVTYAGFYMGVDYCKIYQRSFISYLKNIGYQVTAKQLLKRFDGTQKADLDIEIALDMYRFSPEYDTAILVSGDQDFVYLVDLIQQQGKQVKIVGLDHRTNDELKGICDQFYDLSAITQCLAKRDRP